MPKISVSLVAVVFIVYGCFSTVRGPAPFPTPSDVGKILCIRVSFRGACLFQTRKPDLDSKGDVAFWKPFSRFVISQDAGSAIKGAGRFDLFCGSGTKAEMLAGSLKKNRKLFSF